jgi:hypothetical protein
MRAMSYTVHRWGFSARQPTDYANQAIQYANQGLSLLASGPSAIRFYLNCCLSNANTTLGNVEGACLMIDEGLSNLPPDWKADDDLAETVELVHCSKARYLEFLDRPEDTIEAYNASRAVHPERPPDGGLLDDITCVFSDKIDPTRSRLLALLKTWSKSELIAWFSYIFDVSLFLFYVADNDAVTRLNQIMAMNGKEGQDFVLDCYDKYLTSLPVRSDKGIPPRVALAFSYRRVMNEPRKSKDLHQIILKRNLRDHTVYGIVEQLSETRLSLSDLIFEEFRSSKKSGEKEVLLNEMKQLANQMIGTADWMLLEGSYMSVALALMTRAIRPAAEYEEILWNTFEACVTNLSDSVGWNDSSSLRLLARVLACVEGLERDALIATSCQFSQVTQEATDSLATSSNDASGNGNQAAPGLGRADTFAVPIDYQVQVIEKEIVGMSLDSIDKTPEIVQVEITQEIGTELEAVAGADADILVPSKTTVEVENQTAPDQGAEPKAATDQEPAEAEIPNPYALPEIEDEDTAQNGFNVTCDGECDGSYLKWTEPLYMCIFCPSTDLCTKCHEKRLAQNKGEPNLYWRSYCGKNHRYLKGPIQGWKGVKNGVIRIEGEDGKVEEIKFIEWLKGLKEERWVNAWEKFWLRSADVMNVGC